MGFNRIGKRANLLMKADGNAAEIFIYDDIGPSWAGMVGAKGFTEELQALGNVAALTVRINSYGGDVFEGLAIYNALVKHPAKVTTQVDGIAASISSVIAMAGDTIRMAENAFLMIHKPWTVATGNDDELEAIIAQLRLIGKQTAGIYAARTGNSLQQAMDWMLAETWLTAEEAKDLNFADEMTPNKAVLARFDPKARGFKRAPMAALSRVRTVDRLEIPTARSGMSLSQAKAMLARMEAR